MKLNSKSLNTNKISKNTMKKPIIILASILFIFIFASLVDAIGGTVDIISVETNGVVTGTHLIRATVTLTTIDMNNITNVTFTYRNGASGAWTILGTNTTYNLSGL